MFLGVRLKVYGRIRFEARLYGSSAYLIERSTSSSSLFESNHVRGAILACLFVGVASVYDRGPPHPSTLLPRLFHSHLHFYIYLERTVRQALPRPRLFVAADRPASCGFDKNSSAMTFKYREKVARETDVSKEKRAIKLLFFRPRVYFPNFTITYPLVRMENLKIGKLGVRKLSFRKL